MSGSILPFLFAGVLVLSALNPPYTASLVSLSIPVHNLSLDFPTSGRKITLFLPQASWNAYRYSQSTAEFPPLLSAYRSETSPAASSALFNLPSGGSSTLCGLPQPAIATLPSSSYWQFIFGFSKLASPSSAVLETLVLLFSLVAMRHICSRVVRRFRVLQPSSPTYTIMKVVSLYKIYLGTVVLIGCWLQVPGQAFTPSNSTDELCEEEYNADSDLSELVLSNGVLVPAQAALHVVRTVPLRLSPPGRSIQDVPEDQDMLPMSSFVSRKSAKFLRYHLTRLCR